MAFASVSYPGRCLASQATGVHFPPGGGGGADSPRRAVVNPLRPPRLSQFLLWFLGISAHTASGRSSPPSLASCCHHQDFSVTILASTTAPATAPAFAPAPAPAYAPASAPGSKFKNDFLNRVRLLGRKTAKLNFSERTMKTS